MKIKWSWPKSRIGANLIFETETDRQTVEKIYSLIANAGFDGHVVLAGHGINKSDNTIFLRKWNHFEWPQVCEAIENSIRQEWPDTKFENNKLDLAPE